MHDTFDSLASDLRQAITASDRQFWLGITGAPGSGKSTLSDALCKRLGDEAVVVPMDGYHFYRAELNRMSDPKEAHRRRGAPFTFNAGKFVADLTDAKKTGRGTFPSFQHGIGDPLEDAIRLVARHRIVIVEGNYLLLDEAPWCDLRSIFDETWFIEVEFGIIRDRLKQRFIKNGLSVDAATKRVESNDMLNAKLVREQAMPKACRILRMG